MAENWTEDPKSGLWWNGSQGPYNSDYEKVPQTPGEVLHVLVQMAAGIGVAGLTTMTTMQLPGIDGSVVVPRTRTVSPKHYITADFSEVTVATRACTRKCAEVKANPICTLFWQQQTGKGGWIVATGTARVEDGPATSDPSEQKAKLFLKVARLEVQDYATGIMKDLWAPAVFLWHLVFFG
ncbi:unnamed protein product [Polarella glacialis]|uniref:Pyridoxamine 5'-phosphate oxidase putative domain-containing protein n=1 Tax=Polarella glacialis TaxID=89957 RepID=A0A813IZE3_POLGL|nr:unnamed protein product [Polarella glacialis]